MQCFVSSSPPFRTPSGQYYCPVCNISLNSEHQFGEHKQSKKHRIREGETRFRPHERAERSFGDERSRFHEKDLKIVSVITKEIYGTI